jgi:hypothetical protein
LNFKLVYTDWFIEHNERKPFGNGIHPIIRGFAQDIYKNNLNISSKKKYDGKERLDNFLIAIQTYKEIFKTSSKSFENYNKIISELVSLNNKDLIK